MQEAVPPHTPYVIGTFRLLFNDRYFLKHDGYLPRAFAVGDQRLWKRHLFFTGHTAHVANILFWKYRLYKPHSWSVVVSITNDVSNYFGLTCDMFGNGEKQVIYDVKVDGREAWERDLTIYKTFEWVNCSDDQHEIFGILPEYGRYDPPFMK